MYRIYNGVPLVMVDVPSIVLVLIKICLLVYPLPSFKDSQSSLRIVKAPFALSLKGSLSLIKGGKG